MIYKNLLPINKKTIIKYKWLFHITIIFLIIGTYFCTGIKLHPFAAIFLILSCCVLQSHICCIARDINAEKSAAEQREAFIAILTHDLKTPTIAQIKALDLILNNQMGFLNKEQRELLALTKDSCCFMYDMLSAILSTYKYENGEFLLNYEQCNIVSLAEEAVSEFESLVKEKNITLRINKEGFIFDTNCDRMQIKKAITNILEAAVSYTHNNTEILVTIKQNKSSIYFETKNKNFYINPETMGNLFSKQVSHSEKFNKIGVNLGLYLSKQIINAHKGKIYANRFNKHCNVFGFVLPLIIEEKLNIAVPV